MNTRTKQTSQQNRKKLKRELTSLRKQIVAARKAILLDIEHLALEDRIEYVLEEGLLTKHNAVALKVALILD